jgi:hypothetical protein
VSFDPTACPPESVCPETAHGLERGITIGALAGGFWGAYLGIKVEEHIMEEEWDWERTRLQRGR